MKRLQLVFCYARIYSQMYNTNTLVEYGGKTRDNLIYTDASSQNYSSCTQISFAPGTGGVSHASTVPWHRCSCCTTSYV